MRDYWNDPPETPEPPECCGDLMDVEETGACVCPTCGKRVDPAPEIEPPDLEPCQDGAAPDDLPEFDTCRHGKAAGECDACDHEGDQAFDAARERRMR